MTESARATRGAGWRALLSAGVVLLGLVIIVLPAELAGNAQVVSPRLVGVTWQWVRFADGKSQMDVPGSNYTVTFGQDGQFQARADCNNVLGSYRAIAGFIAMQTGPTTLAACPPLSLGSQFTSYLSQARLFSFTDRGELLLELPADSGTLTFVAQPQVTGTVTYLQRIALPDDAVVRVQLLDVSIADIPARVLGEQVITTGGAQVPFPFAVSYPASAIQENRRYNVAARITDGQGQLLFVSDTATPVITGGNPTSDIEIVVVQVTS